MHKALTYFVVVCLSGLLIALVERSAAKAYDVYYLTVGISEYQNGKNIPGAKRSTEDIEKDLRTAGAVDGTRLVPKQGEYLTRADILGALSDIASKAKAARNSLVVYYFIGHGGSGSDNRSHVSILAEGQPSPSRDVTRSRRVPETREILETREIQKTLEQLNLPYILILDNCYEREPVGVITDFGQSVGEAFSKQEVRLGRIGRKEPAILLYAAKPGAIVFTVPHPKRNPYEIGPLARRLLLVFQLAFRSQKGLTVGDFLKQMNDPAFDQEQPGTVPGDHRVWISDTGAMLIPVGR